MAIHQNRALVVDDDAALRTLTVRELSRNGFACDAAHNGLQARELAATRHYDVIVTDLCMPEMNGHTLAIELLARENRPAVIVLTGVTDSRLAKDLFARGVDDIMFKPFDQGLLALKVRALVDRRASLSIAGHVVGPTPAIGLSDVIGSIGAGHSLESLIVNPAELEAKLAHLAKIMPISQAAIDIIKMTSSDTVHAQQLAATIELDASLAAELLRLANSSFYNIAGQKVVDVHDAVVRIGHKRVGELALMKSAMGAMTIGILPWMDMSLICRQSVAAGLAAELLIVQAGQSRTESGLFLSAIMHPLGRIVLGTLYPDRYQAMLPFSQDARESLQDCEQRVFRRTHTEVLARLLEIWNVPATILEPLKYIHNRSVDVSELSEPLRAKVELTQLAILLGQIAVGQWEAWDRVDFPATGTVRRLESESLEVLIQQLRDDSQAIGQQTQLMATSPLRGTNDVSPVPTKHEVTYCQLAAERFDFLAEILPSMGVAVNICGPTDLSPRRPAVINCLGVSVDQVAELLCPGTNHVLVTDSTDSAYQQFGAIVTLPQSYGVLRSACLKVACPVARKTIHPMGV